MTCSSCQLMNAILYVMSSIITNIMIIFMIKQYLLYPKVYTNYFFIIYKLGPPPS